jgi:hypothetical protein
MACNGFGARRLDYRNSARVMINLADTGSKASYAWTSSSLKGKVSDHLR